MGWGRTLLLGDIGNRLDIDDVERELAGLREQLSDQHNRDASQNELLRHLCRENAELKLYLASLLRLLARKGILDQGELKAMVEAVDAEDGHVDGKTQSPLP